MKENIEIENMPILPMRGIIIFPGMILHFDVTRDKSVEALIAASNNPNKKIFLVSQRDNTVQDPLVSEICNIGVVAEIRQLLKTPNGQTRVLVEGLYKARLAEVSSIDPFMEGYVQEVDETTSRLPIVKKTALMRTLKATFKEYIRLSPKLPQELQEAILSEESVTRLFDLLAFNIYLKPEDRQKLLECDKIKDKLELLIELMNAELQIMALEIEIQQQVNEAVEKNQKDFYLREQIKVLKKQLGEDENAPNNEMCAQYEKQIEEAKFSKETTEQLLKQVDRLKRLSPYSHEGEVLINYFDTLMEFSWNKFTTDNSDLSNAEKQLNKDHYGMKKVKERILDTLAARFHSPDLKGQILCLVGPPGIGKTSIGKSIATALGREYVRISLGGVHDEADIRGHRKTYIGSMPGRIATAIKNCKCMNPLIMLDEVDKMGSDYKGDPYAALLEVLDAEQNHSFVDHFLEIPLNLSKVLFITTANKLDTIPTPLLDRMEIFELNSYTREEKFNIAKKHLVPKQFENYNLTNNIMEIEDGAIFQLIDFYTREAGVRKLERQIKHLCEKGIRKALSEAPRPKPAKLTKKAQSALAEIVKQAENSELIEAQKPVMNFKQLTITAENLIDFLGQKKYSNDMLPKQDEVGTVTGLAWTSIGGVTMPLEVLVMEGTGKIEITGSLGEVMQESAKIAVSLVRSLAHRYGINTDFYKTKDLHIHAPEGATPKDGPSAGVTITTALVSALTGIAVRRDVAMTGEITLYGKVMPIGGLREKSMAAYKAGVKTVLIPQENQKDLQEIDDKVKKNVKFVIAETVQDVLDTALVINKFQAYDATTPTKPELPVKVAALPTKATPRTHMKRRKGNM